MSAQRETFEKYKLDVQRRAALDSDGEYYVDGPSAVFKAGWDAAQAVSPADGWISVNVRLPDAVTEVMVWPNPTDYTNTARFVPGSGWMFTLYEANNGEVIYVCKVKHWMPLPVAPMEAS